MNNVTIDNLDIKSHVRYAEDQKLLDPLFIKESGLIPPLSEITGTSMIYTSQWQTLFQIQRGFIPWAGFVPPVRYFLQGRRFFSYRLFPTAFDDEEGGEERLSNLMVRVIEAKLPDAHHEKERGVVLGLLNEIKSLNNLLLQINGRKLQYQKG